MTLAGSATRPRVKATPSATALSGAHAASAAATSPTTIWMSVSVGRLFSGSLVR